VSLFSLRPPEPPPSSWQTYSPRRKTLLRLQQPARSLPVSALLCVARTWYAFCPSLLSESCCEAECRTLNGTVLTIIGPDNTLYSPTTQPYTFISRSPRLLDPISHQGIGIWYEDHVDCHHFPAQGLVYSPQRPSSLTSTTVGYTHLHTLLLVHTSLVTASLCAPWANFSG
jgi:hypothetical protein